MTSLATFDNALGLLPKAAALLLPFVYTTWKKARLRPVVTVHRRAEQVGIGTVGSEPIEKLAVRLTQPGITVADVKCESVAFTGCQIEQVSPNEVRASFDRFGQYDTLDIRASSPLTVDVIDSSAVPVAGQPSRLLWLVDWGVLLAALVVLGAFIIGPVEERMTDVVQYQSQDNVDHALQYLLVHVAWGLVLAGGLLLAETMLITSRRRRAMVAKSLQV
jgi:hypothetical protein